MQQTVRSQLLSKAQACSKLAGTGATGVSGQAGAQAPVQLRFAPGHEHKRPALPAPSQPQGQREDWQVAAAQAVRSTARRRSAGQTVQDGLGCALPRQNACSSQGAQRRNPGLGLTAAVVGGENSATARHRSARERGAGLGRTAVRGRRPAAALCGTEARVQSRRACGEGSGGGLGQRQVWARGWERRGPLRPRLPAAGPEAGKSQGYSPKLAHSHLSSRPAPGRGLGQAPLGAREGAGEAEHCA